MVVKLPGGAQPGGISSNKRNRREGGRAPSSAFTQSAVPPPPKASAWQNYSSASRKCHCRPARTCLFTAVNRTDEAVPLLAGSLAVIRLTGRGCSSCTPRGWVRMVPGVLELGRQGEQHVAARLNESGTMRQLSTFTYWYVDDTTVRYSCVSIGAGMGHRCSKFGRK